MKLTALLLLTACLTVSATGNSQKVTLSARDASLSTMFASIEEQTDYVFFYNYDLLKESRKVTIDVRNSELKDALSLLFKDQPLDFVIKQKTVFVTRRGELPPATNPATTNPVPPTDITGTLTNGKGEPLSGANVIIKRTGKGVVTAADGSFKLPNVEPDDIIIVSYVGYKTLTIKAGTQTKLTLLMEINPDKLDEVIIQGYGKTSDRLRTGNIVTITSEEIKRRDITNPLLALQGRVPGLQVVVNNGFATAPVKLELRGRKIIDSKYSSEPLIIVDGIPFNDLDLSGTASNTGSLIQSGIPAPAGGESPFFGINPDDIESISVLKDADATAIYGSRGGNGVIIINTKRGKVGSVKITVSSSAGIQEIPKFYDMMNTQEYIAMRKEAFRNTGVIPTAANAPDLLIWDTTRYTDWQKVLWGNLGKYVSNDLSLTGGNNNTQFRFSTSYYKQQSILNYTGSTSRFSLSLHVVQKILKDKITLSFTNSFSNAKVDEIFFVSGVNIIPNAPSIFDSAGKLNFKGWDPLVYPFGGLLRPYYSSTIMQNSGLGVSYRIKPDLLAEVNFGYSYHINTQNQVTPIASQNPNANPTGSSYFGTSIGKKLNIEPLLTYSKSLGNHSVKLIVGGTYQQLSQNGYQTLGSGYVNDELLGSIANALTVSASDGTGNYKYAAIFGRLSYNFRNKYLLNVNSRRDGSSRFAPGRQFGNFYSVGGAWIISEEHWYANTRRAINFLKLRLSYGSVGSDNTGDYTYLSRWTANGQIVNGYAGNISYVPIQHINDLLQWQTNRKFEIGMQANLFKDRVSLEISYYRDRVGNQLVTTPLPAATGFTSVDENKKATIQNSGLEIITRGSLLKKPNLSIEMNFNIAINRNKLVAFPGIENTVYATTTFVGKSLSILQYFHYLGIDPLSGLVVVEDKNKNGSIDHNLFGNSVGDYELFDAVRKAEGGLGFDLKSKRFSASVFFMFVHQPIKLSGNIPRTAPGVYNLSLGNQPKTRVERWQKVGDVSLYPRYTSQLGITDGYFNSSDAVLTTGSFARLKNLSLAYELPVKSKAISLMRLFLRGENLFLLTNWDGVDPETPGFGSLPLPRKFSLGIAVNF